MHCNFSKYSMTFADYPWPNDPSFIYPHRDQLRDYLLGYVKQFDLLKYFKLNCRVDSVIQFDDLKWKIKWTDLIKNSKHEQVFDFIIVASGLLSKPNIPKVKNKQEFQGVVMHSNDFKTNDLRLKDKRVLVVGSSNSSAEIASDLVGHAKSVINVFRRPFWVIPKFIQTKSVNNKEMFVPRDFLLYTRKFAYSNESTYEKYTQICPKQACKNSCPPDLYIDSNCGQSANFGISENYLKLVIANEIEIKKGDMKQFVSNGIQLEDGTIVEADVILYCTGYKLEIPFFSQDLLDKIDYENDTYKNSIILYKHTFHPSLPNLGFVFLNRGLNFVGLDLQSKWIAAVFSGRIENPKIEDMQKEIGVNRLKGKNMNSAGKFSHDFYVKVIDELAKELESYPNYDEESKDKFENFLVTASHFTYNENKQASLINIEQIKNLTCYGCERD